MCETRNGRLLKPSVMSCESWLAQVTHPASRLKSYIRNPQCLRRHSASAYLSAAIIIGGQSFKPIQSSVEYSEESGRCLGTRHRAAGRQGGR
ncbi:hypothetical protein LX32DRAFT_39668 [Colletotrichum zoysiae]|uniref:Uncharacterized protein n=1 Tax=Colletotrichum zoysiae TaxID=1216348 RepID=A0AAD9LYU8_9PEZI|nr:hypothetical protein LX32DRAFT_39668 [Colletotrichum zoysiae]